MSRDVTIEIRAVVPHEGIQSGMGAIVGGASRSQRIGWRLTQVISGHEQGCVRQISRSHLDLASTALLPGKDGRMTFTWKTPPWQRNEDCTHIAVMVTDVGGGQIGFSTESVRGDDATEALADMLMGPGGAGGGAVLLPGLLAIVVRRGIDVMWMAQPPIRVSSAGNGGLNISVAGAEEGEVTAFSVEDAHALLGRIQAQYGG
ncbi:hypothetical protein [Streptomyces sp. NPDC055287]